MRPFWVVRITVLVSMLSCFFCLSSIAKEINNNQVDALVSTCLRLIENGDFRGVALMHHYPSYYSRADLSAAIDGVTGSLKVYTEAFGPFDVVRVLEEEELNVKIFTSGAARQYWDEYPDFHKVGMKAEFDKFGPGFLIIELVNIVGLPEIKELAFGLPVSGESVAKIKQVGDLKMNLVNERQTRLKTM